ncbi:MAG: hypothetical protein AAFZ17_16995 [Cyanobacteria bacterium J06650_10]
MRIGVTFRRIVLLPVLLASFTPTFFLPVAFTRMAAAWADENSAPVSSVPGSSDGVTLLDSWPAFTSEAGLFRVAMPSAPATYTFSPDLDAADSLMYMQMQLTDATHLEIYTAAFLEVRAFDESADVEALLLSCVSGLSDATLQSVPESITLGDYPGVEATFQNDSGLLQVSRCYLAGDRTYLLSASREPFDVGSGLLPLLDSQSNDLVTRPDSERSSRQQNERSQSMEAFFSSFEILDSEMSAP